MTKYRIFLSKTAASQLSKLETNTRERIKTCLYQLEDEPFSRRSGADIKRLITTDEPPLFRLRVGDYRVIYFVVNDEIKVTEILHRSKGYKWLE